MDIVTDSLVVVIDPERRKVLERCQKKLFLLGQLLGDEEIIKDATALNRIGGEPWSVQTLVIQVPEEDKNG